MHSDVERMFRYALEININARYWHGHVDLDFSSRIK